MERFLPSNIDDIEREENAKGGGTTRTDQLRAFAAECERLYGPRYDAAEAKRETAATLRAQADVLEAEAAEEGAALMKERRAAGLHKFPVAQAEVA